jgi:hypothetical protein
VALLERRPDGAASTICLASEGGSLAEGWRLFDYFSSHGISTFVEAAGRCLAACAIGFIGGGTIAGTDNGNELSRSMERGATVAFRLPPSIRPSPREGAAGRSGPFAGVHP